MYSTKIQRKVLEEKSSIITLIRALEFLI